MKQEEWKWDKYYELYEARAPRYSRLSDLDGAVDWLADFATSLISAIRAVYREAMK